MQKNEAKKNLETPNKLPQQYDNRNENNTNTNTSNNNLATSDYYNDKSTTEDEYNFMSRVVDNLKANDAMVRMVEVDKEKLRITFAGKTNKENGVLIVDGGCNTTVCSNGFRTISTSDQKASLVGFSEDSGK